MGPVEAIIVIAIIVGIALLIRAILRRGGPDGVGRRGPASSGAETTATLAAMGATVDAGHKPDHGPHGWGGDGGWTGGGDGGGGGD